MWTLVLILIYVYLLTCNELYLEEFCLILEFEGRFHLLAYSLLQQILTESYVVPSTVKRAEDTAFKWHYQCG